MGDNKMRIAVNLFLITKIGGIETGHNTIVDAFRRLGHEVDTFFISENKKYLKTMYGCKYAVGYMSDGQRQQYSEMMNKYDLIVFSHPCPIKNSSYNTTLWQHCYNSISKPIIVIWWENQWQRRYAWIKDVMPRISLNVATQEKAFNVMQQFPNVAFVRHPTDLTGMGEYTEQKQDMVISPHQFKSWKFVDQFIRGIPRMRCSKEVYGDGIELAFMRGEYRKQRDVYLDKTLSDEEKATKLGIKVGTMRDRTENIIRYSNPDGSWIYETAIASNTKFFGYVEHSTVQEAMRRAKACVDLSIGEGSSQNDLKTFVNINYAVLEAMKYGAVPIVRKYAVIKDLTDNDNVVVVDEAYLIDSTVGAVNDVIENFSSYRSLIRRNHEMLRKNFDHVAAARKYLELVGLGKQKAVDKQFQDPIFGGLTR